MKLRILGLLLALCLIGNLLPVARAAQRSYALPDAALRPAALPAEQICAGTGQYTVTLRSEGPGTAELYTSSANARDRIYFLADPEPGYRVSFEKCGYYKEQYEMELYYIGSNVYEIVMPDGDVVLDLQFVPIESENHPVTVTVGEGGLVTVSQTQGKAGESIFLEVIPVPGARVGAVRAGSAGRAVAVHSLGRVNGADLYEVFMPDGPLQIEVEFTRNGPYSLDAFVVASDEEPGGSIQLSHSQAYAGETVTVTAVPNRGWEVFDLTTRYDTRLTRTGTHTWTFAMPRHGEEVYVSFTKSVYPVSVTVEAPAGGRAELDAREATIGETVTMTCIPDEGYRVARIQGAEDLTDLGGGIYSFVVDDGPVALSVLFLREDNPFLDVNESHFYHDSVIWAARNGITNGVDEQHFGPFGKCSRAQAVTFLWRAAGCPESTAENPFTDVQADAWYAEAVLWAVEMGITRGVSETAFGPDQVCTRAQVVTFLWRAMGCPETAAEHPFDDVRSGSWYEMPVCWALEQGITTGLSGTAFGPGGESLRAQVVTFLYRAYAGE